MFAQIAGGKANKCDETSGLLHRGAIWGVSMAGDGEGPRQVRERMAKTESLQTLAMGQHTQQSRVREFVKSTFKGVRPRVVGT